MDAVLESHKLLDIAEDIDTPLHQKRGLVEVLSHMRELDPQEQSRLERLQYSVRRQLDLAMRKERHD